MSELNPLEQANLDSFVSSLELRIIQHEAQIELLCVLIKTDFYDLDGIHNPTEHNEYCDFVEGVKTQWRLHLASLIGHKNEAYALLRTITGTKLPHPRGAADTLTEVISWIRRAEAEDDGDKPKSETQP